MQTMIDITLYSEGALSYSELKNMTPHELRVAVDSLNRYLKKQEEAMSKGR